MSFRIEEKSKFHISDYLKIRSLIEKEGGHSFYGTNTYGSGGDGRRRYASNTTNGQSGNGGIVVVKSF